MACSECLLQSLSTHNLAPMMIISTAKGRRNKEELATFSILEQLPVNLHLLATWNLQKGGGLSAELMTSRTLVDKPLCKIQIKL
jgi:hypothetical protein